MRPSDTPQRASVKLSTSMSSSAEPLFCVQQPLQSLSPQVSSTVTTIVLPPDDLRHRSWSLSAVKSGNAATMLCDMTHDSVSVLLQPANCPS